MLEKMKKFWKSLDHDVTMNGQKLFLITAACTMAGLVLGTLLSPDVDVTIGSNNNIEAGEDEGEEEIFEEA